LIKKVNIKFLGVLKKVYGGPETSFEIEENEKLKDIIQKLIAFSPKIKKILIDPELDDPRPNAVILINGKEISVLNGLETIIKNKHKIVFLPTIHGGYPREI
jgi:molybdopterin converting factor small subunit